MNSKNENSEDKQFSIATTILLHIFPGVLVLLGFILLRPLSNLFGFPPLLAFLTSITLFDIPSLLIVMLLVSKKETGEAKIRNVIAFKNKLAWKQFILVFIGAFIVSYLLIMLVTPLDNILSSGLSSQLPAWFFLEEQSQYMTYAKPVLIIVFALQIAITGIVLPWVEELYFRGFLLPRISRFGKWSPLLGGALFGLYHVWQFYAFPSLFLLGSVLGYVAWWKKDLRINIWLHILANTISRLMFLFVALSI